MCSRPVTDFYYDREEMLARPEVALERARAAGDVVWSQPMRRWLVVSHGAALQALREPDLEVYDLFRVFDGVEARVGVDLSSLRRICGWIPFLLDGPRHAVLRQVFARLMADIRGPYLATCAEASRDLLGALGAQEDADYARDYAERLHVEVLGRIIGLSVEDRLWIAQVSSSQGSIDFAASVSEMVDANGRARALLERLAVLTQGLPFMNWLGGHLAAAGIADTGTNRLECLTGFLLLGRDTIAGTLTLGLAHLIDAAGGHLRPADLPEGSAIVDEVIRLSSTVQIAIRAARRDLTLAGCQIARGEMLMIFFPAANRDPETFGCPHDLRAGQPAHVAFGSGRHLCVGMPLSRQVVAMALDHLKLFDYIDAAPGRRFDESRNTRKYLHLPIVLRQHHDA